MEWVKSTVTGTNINFCCSHTCLSTASSPIITLNISSGIRLLSHRLIEQGLTSAPTQYRLYGRQFFQVWWPNQQCQGTEGGWL